MSRFRILLPILFSLALPAQAAPAAEADPSGGDPFPVRMVMIGARSPADPDLRAHLEYCTELGFNAVWVFSHQAGRWSRHFAPDGPYLDPAFVELARWCKSRSIRIFVSVNPVSDSRDTFTFHGREGERRIRRFYRLLRRQAGVSDFVLSFDDLPTELHELNDILRYGRYTAPAHLDLARRLAGSTGSRTHLWLCASAYSDVHLGDGTGPYSAAFLRGLSGIPKSVGIVWTGPDVISASITAEDIRRTRSRLGGRKILLYDNYPVNDDSRGLALGLVLGPLRNRGMNVHEQVEVYLASPMFQLGASRLPLATTAAYLADPAGYDPDAAWMDAMRRLAGDDTAALEALRTQASEWGGAPGGRNYRHADEDNVLLAAMRLRDPAYVASYTWTVRRYPERMRRLQGLADPLFRDDLLEAMQKKLAVARTIPLVIEYRARIAAGRSDAAEVLNAIRAERKRVSGQVPVVRALNRFLEAAGIRR